MPDKFDIKPDIESRIVDKAVSAMNGDELNTLMCAMMDDYDEAPALRKHLLELLFARLGKDFTG